MVETNSHSLQELACNPNVLRHDTCRVYEAAILPHPHRINSSHLFSLVFALMVPLQLAYYQWAGLAKLANSRQDAVLTITDAPWRAKNGPGGEFSNTGLFPILMVFHIVGTH